MSCVIGNTLLQDENGVKIEDLNDFRGCGGKKEAEQ